MVDLNIIRTTASPFRNLVYLLTNAVTKTALVVDPAWEVDKILAGLERTGCVLKYILLTHSHFDHVNLVGELVLRFPDVEVYMSKPEIDFYDFRSDNQIPLVDSRPLRLEGFLVHPIHTPGHTFGSVCYLIDGHLFSGDTLFMEGCGICQGAGSDPHRMFDSLQMIKRTVDKGVDVFPGHQIGEPVGKKFGSLLATNLYLLIESLPHFVKFRMRKNQVGLFDFK